MLDGGEFQRGRAHTNDKRPLPGSLVSIINSPECVHWGRGWSSLAVHKVPSCLRVRNLLYCTPMICTSTEEQSELLFIAAIIRLDTLVPDLEHFPLVQLRSGGCCGTCLRLPGKVPPRGISLRHRGCIQLMSLRAGRSGPLSPFAAVFRSQRRLSYRTASRKTTAGDGRND
jgi:hypothetical protein